MVLHAFNIFIGNKLNVVSCSFDIFELFHFFSFQYYQIYIDGVNACSKVGVAATGVHVMLSLKNFSLNARRAHYSRHIQCIL